MTAITRDDVALYVMGAYPGDVAGFEAALADDATAQAMLAEEAALELSLRAAADVALFCPSCGDLVAAGEPARCAACGCAVAPGGYVIERVLVANAHGRMYVARDADGARVALKELAFVQSPSAQTIAAFEREAKFLRALSHPAIPRYRSAFEEGSGVHTRYYLAQELVEGTPLDTRLDEHFYSETEILDVARQVLHVLVYLQSLSPMVIHRDIKPANLLRREDGTIAVVDFGAAHVQGTTAGSTSIGTFGYMPLEQLAGVVDATTDGYALGASLHQLLTRREPWRILTPTTSALAGIANVSPGLTAFLGTLVAPDPKDRFATAAAARAALDRVGDAPSLVPRRRRRWKPVAAIAGAALLFGGGAGVAGYALHSAPPAPRMPAIIEPTLPPPPVPPAPPPLDDTTDDPGLDSEKTIKLDFTQLELSSALQAIATECNYSLVVPQYTQPVTLTTSEVPCAAILQSVLRSHSLSYVYDSPSRALRVTPHQQLQRDLGDMLERAQLEAQAGIPTIALPRGVAVDFDFPATPAGDVLKALAHSGNVNLVVGANLTMPITVHLAAVPWDTATMMVLASAGLGYTYNPKGRILRVAPISELMNEARETIELRQLKK